MCNKDQTVAGYTRDFTAWICPGCFYLMNTLASPPRCPICSGTMMQK